MNKNNNRHMLHFFSFTVLCMGYLLTRYLLFEFHGMKEWPFDLFAGCLAILIISYIGDFRAVTMITSVSYMTGFFVGLFLHKTTIDDIAGRSDNLWFIWLMTIITAVTVSVIMEIMRRKNKHTG